MMIYPMKEMSAVLTVLSAMITPAVLILASGSLLLTTSQRLNRAIDRARAVLQQLEEATRDDDPADKIPLLLTQIASGTKRAWYLQRAMSTICIALATFVATSIAIGIIELTQISNSWIPTVLGIVGVCLLFYATILFVLETRIAYQSVQLEMQYITAQSQRQALQRQGRTSAATSSLGTNATP